MSEFRRYRQVLGVLYAVVGASGIVLLTASIVNELFLHKKGDRPPPSPADLLACNRDVRALLEGLGETAAAIHLEAVRGDVRELGTRWSEFERNWKMDWEDVDRRCHFDELANTGTQPLSFERMAYVHRSLAASKLWYREDMARFEDEQARWLAEMREALDKSRVDLEKGMQR